VNTICARRLAGILGFLAVALGAFGAHGLKATLALNGTAATWEKAVLFHLAHAIVLLVLAVRGAVPSLQAWGFTAGIGLFSGSLYCYSLWKIGWLVALTPIGGVCFLVGWGCVALRRE
jgi:uncharacterized membrane protein YgdD (TMEM256/DUF423 family)